MSVSPDLSRLPLARLRVIEVGNRHSTAFCGRVLADLGARVSVFAAPDDRRGPYGRGDAVDIHLLAGKTILVGEASLLDALTGGAVLVVDRRAGELAVDVVDLVDRFPALQVLAIDATADGAYSHPAAASDYLVEFLSGFAWHQSVPVADPTAVPPYRTALREGVYALGLCAAVAVLAIARGGVAGMTRLGVLDFHLHLLVEALGYWNRGQRTFGRVSGASSREVAGGLVFMLECSDGWIIASPRESHQWNRWIAMLGHPAWAADEALFGTSEARRENADLIHRHLSSDVAKWTQAELFAAARDARVPCFPVNRAEQLRTNEQLIDRRFFRALGDERIAPGLPIRIDRPDRGSALARSRNETDPAASASRQAGALAGIRVLDFSWVIAGPMTTKMLGAMGAEIVKVETTTRSEFSTRNDWYPIVNANKRSVTINLRDEAGQDVLRALAQRSDVVIENFSKGVLDRYGLGAAELTRTSPELIYVSSSGLGREGPLADCLAYGSLLQAYSGRAALLGAPNSAMQGLGLNTAWTDPVTALWATVGILAVLHDRDETGLGGRLDLSMIEATVALLPEMVLANDETEMGRLRSNDSIIQHLVACADEDGWIAIDVRTDREAEALLELVSEDDQGGDQTALVELLTGWASRRTSQDAENDLLHAGVPATKVRDLADVMNEPEGYASTMAPKIAPGLHVSALPWQLPDGDRGRLTPIAPLGGDTRDILAEILGMDSPRFDEMVTAGALV